MKTLLRTALCALTLAAALPAHAVGNLVDVNIIDRDTGETLSVYYHRGEYWVAGLPGHRYSVALNNGLYERTLSVVSVDGVNAVSGETAAWNQTGYVLANHQSAQITGWRKSRTEVAAFVFTALPQSYAARTGRPQNVGTIGVATFREKPLPPPPPPVMLPRRSDSEDSSRNRLEAPAAAPAAAASGRVAEMDKRSEQLGTGHGQREQSEVSYTDFERAHARPDEVLVIRYDSRDNLIAAGIIAAPYPYRPRPEPFPASRGYVPDPPPRW